MAVVAPAPIAVTDFATFGARLNAQIGIGSDTELVATIGRKLPAAGVWGADVCSTTGSPVPAEIGSMMARLTALGDKVDWSSAAFTWVGPDDIIRFCMYNQDLFEMILKAALADSPPVGAGSSSPEIMAGQKASYEELTVLMSVDRGRKPGNGRVASALGIESPHIACRV